MNSKDKEFVFSESVKAGKRIYYFDVKESRNGERFVSITESKKIVDETNPEGRPTFEKHKIFLYKEDFDKFITALSHALNVAKGEEISDASLSDESSEFAAGDLTSSELLSDDEIKIDVDF